MDKLIAIAANKQLIRQRNLFLFLSIVLAVSLACSLIKLVAGKEKTILVPGLEKELWVGGSGISRSYLEEATLMYMPLLLDLNASVIDYKKHIVLKYVSQSKPEYMKAIVKYFAAAKEQYQQFDLSTYFSVKNLQIDQKNLQVIAQGVLTSCYGKQGFDSRVVSYLIAYEWLGNKIRLKEFKQVSRNKTGNIDDNRINGSGE